MQRLKPGELVALESGGKHYVLPPAGSIDLPAESGFVALIDFIEPRRANAVARIGKGLQTDSHLSFTRTKALIRQGVLGPPLWYIYDRAFRILPVSAPAEKVNQALNWLIRRLYVLFRVLLHIGNARGLIRCGHNKKLSVLLLSQRPGLLLLLLGNRAFSFSAPRQP